MTKLRLSGCVVACVMATLVVAAQEPAWNAAATKECDRACLIGILDDGLGNGWTPGSGR